MGIAENIIEELESGKVYPVYLFLGEDRGSKDEVVLSLKGIVLNEEEMESATTYFYGDDAEAAEIVESLSNLSIFSLKSLVIVHDVDRLKAVKLLIDYIGAPNSESILLLFSDKNAVSKRLESAVTKSGRVVKFWPMFQNEGERWLKRRLSSHNVSAEPEALKYIIEVTGTGRYELNNQVEHIVNYCNKGELLTFEMAASIIAKLNRFTVFDLCNRLWVAKKEDILSIFRYLVTTGEELVKIEYFVNRELRKILRAYGLLENAHAFSQVASKLGLRKLASQRISKIVSTVPRERVKRFYAGLADLDNILKTRPREIGLVLFERLLLGAGV